MIRATMIRNAWRDFDALARALARRLFEDRLTQAAGSLTYTTVLSLVPRITGARALSTAVPAVSRTMGGSQESVLESFLPDAGLGVVVEQLKPFTASVGRLTTVGGTGIGVTSIRLTLTIA